MCRRLQIPSRSKFQYSKKIAKGRECRYSVLIKSPELTTQNAGSDDAADSDADPATGLTAAVALAEGETNLTVDAGVACPQPSPPCKFIVKRVSVDGGATFVDADQCTDELLAEDFGAIYEICVTNCGDKTLDLVRGKI